MKNLASAVQLAMAAMLMDDMTDLGNMLALQRDADQAIADVTKVTHYIFGDLNGFKTINDTRSHAAGDAVISQTGASLKLLCDKWKIRGYHKSGDEFVLLTPDNLLDDVIKDLKSQFKECRMLIGDDIIEFSASFGVRRMEASDLRTIEEHAELACQFAKQAGAGENVCVWTEALSLSFSDRRIRCKICGTSTVCKISREHSNKPLHCPVCQDVVSSGAGPRLHDSDVMTRQPDTLSSTPS